MTTTSYKATKSRSNRPGWSVSFRHPCRSDARGKFGLKVRRGLGTTDDAKADMMVEQLNVLLSNQYWWSLDRKKEAERQFDEVVVSAFFDGIQVGRVMSRDLREEFIPLPTQQEGYARVMLVGVTGAGKTTLLRHLIGSDRDSFPSTSTAKTTTADIEIVTAANPYRAAITFMNEHEVRCAVDECLEEACICAIREIDPSDAKIAEVFLEHREQRFRLSYILGSWPQDLTESEAEYEFDMDFEQPGTDPLADDEAVTANEISRNSQLLREYVTRIRKVATAGLREMSKERRAYHELDNANQRQEWLEEFTDVLYENEEFSRLSLDIMDAVRERFDSVDAGEFERDVSEWPHLWYYEERDRDAFLEQVLWFSSNHARKFGRLLTPLVDGIRVCGPFQPSATGLNGESRKLVLMDGEGLGHSAKEATSVSTKVTEKFSEVNMILLVDSAQSPMQAAPMELLRSVGSSGHGHKLAVAFTHFDQVKGDNLSTSGLKRSHVRKSVGNAVSTLRESLGAPVSEIMERQLGDNVFYLGNLDEATSHIHSNYVKSMGALMELMQKSPERAHSTKGAPIYNIAKLELPLRDAADGFKNPWWGRLGLRYYEGIRKEHWGRIKALCRRIANLGADEYSGLRPVADLVRQLQTCMSLWLDRPDGWTEHMESEEEQQVAINAIRQKVYDSIHDLARSRLIGEHSADWLIAFGYSGRGSSFERARRMERIYEAAAPSVTSVMDRPAEMFLDEIVQLVNDAIKDTGGSILEPEKRKTTDVI